MDMLSLVMASVRVVGWMLIHFLWQGMLLGLLYRVLKSALPRGEARYRLGMVTLIVMAACPLLSTWRMLRTAYLEIEVMPTFSATARAAHSVTVDAPWALDSLLNEILPWLVLAWLLGVLFLSMRAWRQWRRVGLLVRAAECVPTWQAMVTTMAKRFGLRRQVRVLSSKVIATPVLVGWIRPVILLPMAVACNFPTAQIELIFAHELAHLRRWDLLANLFQVALETLHFYHPVVHWVSREVRNEREICCDAMALSVSGGSRYEFVAALAELGEMSERHGSLLLGARGGVLLDRVQQMILRRPEPARVVMPVRLVAVLLAAVLLATILRLEWSQAQLQRNLTESLEQLTVTVTPRWLPLAQSIEVPPWSDLVPEHVKSLRPAAIDSSRVGMAESARLPIDRSAAMALPRFSAATMRIPDLPFVDKPLHLPIADQQASAAIVPAALTPIRMRQPVYPEAALIHGIEGKVVVEFGIAADGSVQDLSVISAKPADTFDQAALQAMRGWKYDVSGEGPAQRRYRQTLAFTLNPSGADGARANASTTHGIEALASCQVSTGTHICRWPDNSNSAGARLSSSLDHEH